MVVVKYRGGFHLQVALREPVCYRTPVVNFLIETELVSLGALL